MPQADVDAAILNVKECEPNNVNSTLDNEISAETQNPNDGSSANGEVDKMVKYGAQKSFGALCHRSSSEGRRRVNHRDDNHANTEMSCPDEITPTAMRVPMADDDQSVPPVRHNEDCNDGEWTSSIHGWVWKAAQKKPLARDGEPCSHA